MSHYRPSMDNLIETVGQFLDELAPSLSGELKYRARVSSFLLSICRRELADDGAKDTADLAAWRKLLNSDLSSAFRARRELCNRIRQHDFDNRFEEALTAILERTADEVRIVRPDHLGAPP